MELRFEEFINSDGDVIKINPEAVFAVTESLEDDNSAEQLKLTKVYSSASKFVIVKGSEEEVCMQLCHGEKYLENHKKGKKQKEEKKP